MATVHNRLFWLIFAVFLFIILTFQGTGTFLCGPTLMPKRPSAALIIHHVFFMAGKQEGKPPLVTAPAGRTAAERVGRCGVTTFKYGVYIRPCVIEGGSG